MRWTFLSAMASRSACLYLSLKEVLMLSDIGPESSEYSRISKFMFGTNATLALRKIGKIFSRIKSAQMIYSKIFPLTPRLFCSLGISFSLNPQYADQYLSTNSDGHEYSTFKKDGNRLSKIEAVCPSSFCTSFRVFKIPIIFSVFLLELLLP